MMNYSSIISDLQKSCPEKKIFFWKFIGISEQFIRKKKIVPTFLFVTFDLVNVSFYIMIIFPFFNEKLMTRKKLSNDI